MASETPGAGGEGLRDRGVLSPHGPPRLGSFLLRAGVPPPPRLALVRQGEAAPGRGRETDGRTSSGVVNPALPHHSRSAVSSRPSALRRRNSSSVFRAPSTSDVF